MKKLFCLTFIAYTILACSDSDIEEDMKTSSDFYKLKSISDKEIIYKYKDFQFNKKQILGARYDVAAGYLDFNAVKAPIIDLEKVSDNRIFHINSTFSESINCAGKDAQELLSNMAHSIKVDNISKEENLNPPLFTDTLLSHNIFSSEYDHSSQYSFASCEQAVRTKRHPL